MMPIPSVAFRPGSIFCPSCNAPLPKPVETCPRCKFTAAVCLQKYPFDPPAMERFIDPEERFESRDRRRLNRAFDRFEKRFPQTRLHLCMTRLPGNADCREFGYWLFNICQPRTLEEESRRYYSILFVIDRNKRAASVTLGYGLDPFIDDTLIKRLLTPSRKSLQNGQYADGVLHFLNRLDHQMQIECVGAQEDAVQWASDQAQQPQAQTERSGTETNHPTHAAADVA